MCLQQARQPRLCRCDSKHQTPVTNCFLWSELTPKPCCFSDEAGLSISWSTSQLNIKKVIRPIWPQPPWFIRIHKELYISFHLWRSFLPFSYQLFYQQGCQSRSSTMLSDATWCYKLPCYYLEFQNKSSTPTTFTSPGQRALNIMRSYWTSCQDRFSLATGRFGPHCNPDPWTSYHELTIFTMSQINICINDCISNNLPAFRDEKLIWILACRDFSGVSDSKLENQQYQHWTPFCCSFIDAENMVLPVQRHMRHKAESQSSRSTNISDIKTTWNRFGILLSWNTFNLALLLQKGARVQRRMFNMCRGKRCSAKMYSTVSLQITFLSSTNTVFSRTSHDSLHVILYLILITHDNSSFLFISISAVAKHHPKAPIGSSRVWKNPHCWQALLAGGFGP